MKEETPKFLLLCRNCSSELDFPVATIHRRDLNGYCEKCSVNTGHLNIVEILAPLTKIM